MSIVSVETLLILNDRVFGFPCGQGTPEAALLAAFELGKRSAPLAVDENPFLIRKRRSFIRPEPHQGAEAVAWLRGHYLAREVIALEEVVEYEEVVEFKQAA